MVMSAELTSKFADLQRQWWSLHEWKILAWDSKLHTNKQTIKKPTYSLVLSGTTSTETTPLIKAGPRRIVPASG